MPNHCFNRVEFYSNDKEEEIKKLHDIFSIDVEAEDEERTIFGQYIPEPHWPTTPLAEEDVSYWLHDKRGEVNELPVPGTHTEDLILNLQVMVMTGGMTGDLNIGIPNGIAMT